MREGASKRSGLIYAADQYRYKISHLLYWPHFFVPPFSLMAFSTSSLNRVMACDGRVRESEPLGSGRPSFESVSDRRTRHARYLVTIRLKFSL